MTEFLFYHLQAQPIERVLPVLLERSLSRGWRVVVQTSLEERVDALDSHLWTFAEESFLPHGTFREPTAADQPVLLTLHDHNPNGAVVLFDGEDDEAVGAAREQWKAAAARGFEVTYWQADEAGRWQRRR
jgi:DNA polymerase III subunit chi